MYAPYAGIAGAHPGEVVVVTVVVLLYDVGAEVSHSATRGANNLIVRTAQWNATLEEPGG